MMLQSKNHTQRKQQQQQQQNNQQLAPSDHIKFMNSSLENLSSTELNLQETIQSIRQSLPHDRVIEKLLSSVQYPLKQNRQQQQQQQLTLPRDNLVQIVDKLLYISQKDPSFQLPGEKAMNHLLIMLCKYAEIERALQLWQLMNDYWIKLSGTSVNVMIDMLMDHGKCFEAMNLFQQHSRTILHQQSQQQMHDKMKNPLTVSLVLQGLVANRRPRQALRVLAENKELLSKFPSTIVKSFFSSLMRIGYFDDLNRIIQHQLYPSKMSSSSSSATSSSKLSMFSWDEHSLNALMRAFIENNKNWKACELLEMMCDNQTSSKLNISKPNSTTFEILISAFLAKNDTAHAQELLDYMFHNGDKINIQPTLSILTLFFTNCSENNNLRELSQLFNDLRTKYHLEPNMSIYSIMVKTYKSVGDIDRATAIIDEMKSKGIVPPTSLIVETIASHVASGQLDDAEKYLETVWNERQLKPVEKMQLIYGVLQAYLNHGPFVAKMKSLINRMEADFAVTPDVRCYNALISAMCQSNDVESARKLLTTFSPDITTFSILISAYAQQNKFNDALKLLDVMKAQYHLKPSYDIYNVLLAYYSSPDGGYDMIKARKLFNMMMIDRNNQPTRTALEYMIRGYLMKNMEKEALEIYELHKKRGLTPSYRTLKSFIHFYSKNQTVGGVTNLRKWRKQLKDQFL